MSVNSVLSHSPIQKVNYAGLDFYIKRDDLLNPYFSGNKARKFAYYLANTPSQTTHIVGYGSVQANSLYSLAALAHIKGWQLDYYVDRIPHWLSESSTDNSSLESVSLGNYAQALKLGANVIERKNLTLNEKHTNSNLDTFMHQFAKTLPSTSLFIPEGGRSITAQHGVNVLAQELADYCKQHDWFDKHQTINIMLPAGTGTTALFLQTWFRTHNLPINVLTCACVGDTNYLKQQFSELNPVQDHWPTILPTQQKYHFGKLYSQHYIQWKNLLKNTDIEFDLLYDPMGWESILSYLHMSDNKTPVIYIHQGGLVGNQSMIPRYQRKYPHLF